LINLFLSQLEHLALTRPAALLRQGLNAPFIDALKYKKLKEEYMYW